MFSKLNGRKEKKMVEDIDHEMQYPRLKGKFIYYKGKKYRVLPAAYEQVAYCTNVKWQVEAIEQLAMEVLEGKTANKGYLQEETKA